MSTAPPAAEAALAELLGEPPLLHHGGTVTWMLADEVLSWLAGNVDPGWRTLETGCGSSSIVFSIVGTEHTMIAPHGPEHERVRDWCAARGIPTDRTTSLVADSADALPTITGELDLGLIDGAHAFPMPFVDFLYIARLLRVGGLVIVDDTNLPPCEILQSFLLADRDRWERVRRFDRAIIFRKTDPVVVSPLDWPGQPWVLEELARQSAIAARVGRAIRDPSSIAARLRAYSRRYRRKA